jgi:hypothetical protein
MTEQSQKYDVLAGKLRALLILVERELPRRTIEFVEEFLDHNELALSLEVMAERLVESEVPISRDVLAMVEELSSEMELGPSLANHLRPLVRS